MIYRYKVVTKDRDSIIVYGSKYSKLYKKGTIVSAKKESLGIFCFKTIKNAKNFLANERIFSSDRLILKVKPIGRGKVPKYIASVAVEWRIDLFYNRTDEGSNDIPKGTICYQEVEVLE